MYGSQQARTRGRRRLPCLPAPGPYRHKKWPYEAAALAWAEERAFRLEKDDLALAEGGR